MAQKITATIALHTLNSASWLRAQLAAIDSQIVDFEYEILAIDSGSTDDTVAIFKEHPKVRLHTIPNSEFGHGKTRNLSTEMAKGEFILFLTHDAIPAHNHWLAEMIYPFSLNSDIVCVYGKQIALADSNPITKRDIIQHFKQHGPDYGITLQHQNPLITDQEGMDAVAFFSDVNSALRSKLLAEIPYRDLAYAEDQAMGQDVIAAGLTIAYTPFGAVYHSHSYPLKKYFRRVFDETIGLKAATGQTIDTSLLHHAKIITAGTLRDWRFILRDRDYSASTKLKWLVQTPAYNASRRLAVRLGSRDNLPRWARNILSLERQSKSKAR